MITIGLSPLDCGDYPTLKFPSLERREREHARAMIARARHPLDPARPFPADLNSLHAALDKKLGT
jgi:hypothetical protein